jgi:hypothetical protein
MHGPFALAAAPSERAPSPAPWPGGATQPTAVARLKGGFVDRLALLLPITIDAYAMTSARVWLAGTGNTGRARRFARANAVGAIVASVVGNAAYHAISVGLLTVSWPIVVLVGAVPATVLGLTAHLHTLRSLAPGSPSTTTDKDRTGTRHKSGPEGGTEVGPSMHARSRSRRRAKSRTEDGLMAAAREADAKYRAAHDGRPITRDALRAALHIAERKATELR